MAVPAGGEIAIYNDVEKTSEHRLILGLDYPALTAQKQELFAGALDPEDFWFTQTGGAPDVSGGTLNFELFGGALRQLVITRPHWFPTDDRAFQIAFGVQFPTDDPVYSPVVLIGGLDAEFGALDEPLRLVQLGSAARGVTTSDIGKIYVDHNANFLPPVVDDKANHDYVLEWDPDGTPQTRITKDASEIYTSNLSNRPYYVAFGFIWPTQDLTGIDSPPDEGTPGSPKVTMKISDLTISSFGGDGYESRTYPGWTSANAGGNIDTAIDGERFSLDGETWAKVPTSNTNEIRVRGGRATNNQFDTLDVGLVGPEDGDPETTPNIFTNNRVVNRNIFLDTRGTDSAAASTAWKRQFAGVVTQAEWKGDSLSLSARDRPMDRLDSFISKGYTSLAAVTELLEGELEGIELNFTIDQILDDLVDVSDAVAGGVLGATATQIRGINTQPLSIGTGGQSLLGTFLQWCERLGHECWRKYTVTGAERYGQIRVNQWTLTGSSGYTFRGKGASGGNTNLTKRVTITEDRQAVPGQVYYRNDTPVVEELNLDVSYLPVLGLYPQGGAYPPNNRVLNDSFGMLTGFGLTSLQQFHDKDDNLTTGGIGPVRWSMEAARGRIAEFEVHAHDWIEPVDIVAIDDPDDTGLETTEVWVVDNRTLIIRGSTMTTTVQCMTGDYLKAIRRTL